MPNAPTRTKRNKREYTETPDWGTLFERRENEPPRPQFSGTAIISEETLKMALRDGGQVQVALWTRNRDGQYMRNSNGSLRFRLHIEPVFQSGLESTVPDEEPLPF